MEEFTHGALRIAHRTMGHGPVHVLAFHGYGGSTADFAPLFPTLAGTVTLHAFDIWFNGHSRWPEGRPVSQPLRPEELRDLMAAYMDRHGIGHAYYMGFSLGGRLALTLAEHLPQRSLGALLLAPDGLVRHPWYRWLSRFAWGRALYRGFQGRPGPWFAALDALHAVGLVRPKRYAFLRYHTDDRARRQLVHDVWLSLRLLEPDLRRAAAHMRRTGRKLHLYMGRYDSVVKLRWGRRLLRRAPDVTDLTVLETGHIVVTPALARRLKESEDLWTVDQRP
ncbi:MAG: alpha/beta fold hydrolase [Flavobacteriales bacterium]|jgi:pimeloyl-ACP methyl ester carboxylesterase|nr:alpha/beta fold hydrolase [Flavobacteriales bacterium]